MAGYWDKRLANERAWISKNLKSDQDFAGVLDKRYSVAADTITQMITNELAHYSDSTGISLATAKRRVSASEINSFNSEYKSLIKSSSKAAKNRLRLYNVAMRINHLEYLKASIGQELVKATDRTDKGIRDQVSQDTINEYKRQSGLLGGISEAPSITETAKIVDAQTNGASFSDRLWGNSDALKAELDQLLTQSLISADSPRELASKLVPLVRDKVKNARYVAERLARTESARAQTKVQLDSFAKYGYDWCKWVAEPSACPACLEISEGGDDGTGVYTTDDVPNIPVHPNCRCSISAWYDPKTGRVPDSLEDASSDSDVDDSRLPMDDSQLPMDELLSKYSNPEFTKALGQDRAEKFVSGLAKAPKPIRDVYAAYAPQFKISAFKDGTASFYNPATRMIQFNKENVDGNAYCQPMDTVYHELGHLIDNLSGDKTEKAWDGNKVVTVNVSRSNNMAFKKLLKKEIDDNSYALAKEQPNFSPFDPVGKTLFKGPFKNANWIELGDISDMLQANAGLNLGYGHSKNYYKGRQGRDFAATEAWAEMSSATINNPASLKWIKKLAPKSYAMWLDMVTDALKKAKGVE